MHSLLNKITVISEYKQQIRFQLFPDEVDDYYLWKTEETVFPRGIVLPCDMILTKEQEPTDLTSSFDSNIFNNNNNNNNNNQILFPKP